jgi:enoyl-CoA hydratase/carnithine racemase
MDTGIGMSELEDVVRYERLGEHVAVVTLNRPQARNAINGDVARAIDALRIRIEADPEIRVAILASTGTDVFCAGADLKEVSSSRAGASGLSTPGGGFAGFVKAERKKPWIAAVRGKALGGGFELALACDMVVAGQNATFGLPEVKIGVLAAAGGAFRVAQILPRAIANELLSTGRSVDAAFALSHGLINRVVADDAVLDEAVRLAEDIVKNAPISVRASLDIVRAATELGESELWKMTDAWAQRIIRTDDAKEGPRAFLEKRAPRWAGR